LAEAVRVAGGGTSLELVAGGEILHRVIVEGTATLEIAGGRLGDHTLLRDAASASMSSGGLLALRTAGAASMTITGGTLAGTIEATDSSSVELHVLDRASDGVLTGFAGVLNGRLADGSEYLITYVREPTARIELVPEPASALGALAAVAGLAAVARRRARGSQTAGRLRP
jgi:hypothetical protein